MRDRRDESARLLQQLVDASDAGIPKELLETAEGVAGIAAVQKVAFGFGGRYGRGVAVCRKDGGKGPWGAPAMIGWRG